MVTGGAGFIGAHLVRASADINLARRLLGYEPEIDFETGLRQMYDAIRFEAAPRGSAIEDEPGDPRRRPDDCEVGL